MDKYQLDHKMKLGNDFESQGKPLHAVQIYVSVIEESPDYVEAYFKLANLYDLVGNIQSAVKLLKEYLEKNPEDKDVRIFLGQFLLKNDRWDDAVEVLSFILPEEEPVVAFFIGYAHFMQNEFELAKLNLLNFLSFQENNELLHEANIYMAKIELKLKNYESALSYAKRSDSIYSNFWELNQIYAETYYNLGMYAHAVAPIEKAIKLNPGEALPYEWAGKVYLKLGEYQKAEKNFLLYIEAIEDVSSDIYTKLAEACLKNKNPKDALAYYDIAIKLDPSNELAKKGKNMASTILNNNMVSDG